MRNSVEYKMLFNLPFCASLIYESVREFNRMSPERKEMGFELCYLVLPICMDEGSAKAVSGINAPGILARAIGRYPQISIGLQNRMENFLSLTEQAVTTGQLVGLLDLEAFEDEGGPRFGIYPKRSSSLSFFRKEDSKIRVKCARKLGAAFEEVGRSTVAKMLGVTW